MVTSAALRMGIKMQLRSRDWIATPEKEEVIIDKGKSTERTCERVYFKVIKKLKDNLREFDDGDLTDYWNRNTNYSKEKESSSTIFFDPPPKLIDEFRSIRDKVLYFNPKPPIVSTENVDLLKSNDGKLFVRGLLIPGDHEIKYSYNLKSFNIKSRDREDISNNDLKDNIRELLEATTDEDFISTFLTHALSYSQYTSNTKDPKEKLEFHTSFEIKPKTEQADLWIKTFQKEFGKRTSVRAQSDSDFNAVHMAQHMGLTMVTLPDSVANSINNIVGTDGKKIASYKQAVYDGMKNIIPVSENDLTEVEKQRLSQLYKYNKILALAGITPIKKINIYDYPDDYIGERAAGFADNGNGIIINISRDSLNNGILDAGDVYFHEVDHAKTGAEDADVKFRDWLTLLLSGVSVKICPLLESIENSSVLTNDTNVEDLYALLNNLKQVLGKNQEELGGFNYE